jgi:hypothetical protein
MVFVGDDQPPSVPWPDKPFTVVQKTPAIREKPYLIFEDDGFKVVVPGFRTEVQSTSQDTDPGITININLFYIAKPATDIARSINGALQAGYHVILTPGIYHLTESLHVNQPDTVILGLGMPTLIADNGTTALIVEHTSGVVVSGIIIDAATLQASPLVLVGPANIADSQDRSTNPSALFDISCRVGGALAGSTQTCMIVNTNNVIMDNIWIWRADHGLPGTVGWNINPAETGLIVNGKDVIAYGLFVEHFQGFQTLWNGDGGQVYFYQSEIPYDVPDQPSWTQSNGDKGFPSYKISDQVTTHTATGLGIYCNFHEKVELENAIATPTRPGIKMSHMVTRWLDGVQGSSINHIINKRGDRVPALQPALTATLIQ